MRLANLQLFVRSMGKEFRVKAWFPDDDAGTCDANAYLEKHPDDGVMAATDGLILICGKYEGSRRI